MGLGGARFPDPSAFEGGVACQVTLALAELEAGAALLAAVSGGADSTAMLAALAASRDDEKKLSPFSLHCIHVDHALRGAESCGDALFVRELCGKLAVPCRVIRLREGAVAERAKRRGCGIEAAARELRHGAFKKELARLDARFVLTAHTRDDRLEQILMRLLRGAGPAGLAPLPFRRGRILRPLIALRRRDVLAYLAAKNLEYRTDSSNSDTRFLRNRVRRYLVPLLNEQFPHWEAGLSAMAETQGLVAEGTQWALVQRGMASERGADSPGSIMLPHFFEMPLILREEAIFAACDRLARSRYDAFFPDPLPCFAPPRRKTVRRFCAEETPKLRCADLGSCTIETQNNGAVYVTAKMPFVSMSEPVSSCTDI
jgi:tRNA(Ile)-lysidine synthase